MKSNLHPTYYQATITCACGNSFTTGSTSKDLRVDICSKCHPFFTGETKFIDTLGKVDRFMAKRLAAAGRVVGKKGKSAAKAAKTFSLKEMLTVTKTDRSDPALRDKTTVAAK